MLTKEQEPSEPWGESTDPMTSGRGYRYSSEVCWVITILQMCECEVRLIHYLWFVTRSSGYSEPMFAIPIYVLVPGLFALSLRFVIGKMSKVGQISLRGATSLKYGLGILTMFIYLAIGRLADIAFH